MARVVLKRSAIREILTSPEMRADLERRGRQIAGAAGPGYDTQTWTGRNRARVTVATATREARRNESRTRALLRSLGAGR